MTTLHPLRVADAAATTHLDPVTLDALVKRVALVLSGSESLGDITQGAGEIALAVIRSGGVFFYDAADSTTADDGVTCLVDGSGHRYKRDDAYDLDLHAVISVSNTPPGSPSVGDAYVVDTAPSGAWSAHAKAIAYYTRRGWVYEVPRVGRHVLNKATGANIQYGAAASWGGFGGAIADGTIRPRQLDWEMGLAVESKSNTPPGSPTVGLYYIVDSSPTGAWSGKSGQVATYYNSAWEFIAPYEGAVLFLRSGGYQVAYISGAWARPSTIDVQLFATAGSFTWTKPVGGSMAFIQVWGAGGSGGRAGSTDYGGGGGGGHYAERWVPLASLGSTETVTVGAGGAARTSDDQDGQAGGNSSFGGWLTGYGGGGGAGAVTAAGGGGGGGGDAGAGGSAVGGGGSTVNGAAGGTDGITTPAGGTSGTSGTSGADGLFSGGAGGGAGTSGTAGRGGHSRNGGGGGGGGANDSNTGGAGGNSRFGGGGGGGGGGSGTAAGGTSLFGGNGGAGAPSGSAASSGSAPGGGGGGSRTGNSGAGAAGQVRITVF